MLDTHVLLHWVLQNPKLSKTHEASIKAATPEAPLYVSEITFWEIATLYSLGRVTLTAPLQAFLERVTAPPLIERLNISPAVAAEVAALPDSFHRDPGDRMIVASARVYGATLLTQDRRIIDAGLVRTLS